MPFRGQQNESRPVCYADTVGSVQDVLEVLYMLFYVAYLTYLDERGSSEVSEAATDDEYLVI